MLSKTRELLLKHFKSNKRTYFFLLLAFILGISAGAFTVNGLSALQREDLSNYFQGFLQLFVNQKVDSGQLFNIALRDNFKLVGVLWVLGLTIIGIPFIYLIIGIRGFLTGFSSGFMIQSMGGNGVLFSAFAILPKELIAVPCFMALGVNGIRFSMSIIRSRSIRSLSKENLKTRFFGYCIITTMISLLILCSSLVEAYVIPVLVRLMANNLTG